MPFTADTSTLEPGFTSTDQELPYQRPLTATERLAKEQLEKRRRRAIKNGRLYK